MAAAVELSGRDLTPAALDQIAREDARVTIAPSALETIRDGHQTLARAVAGNTAIYGVTTGLGSGVTTRIDPTGDDDASLRTLRARAACVGDPLPRAVVRAAMAARLNGFCIGTSGVGTEAAETLAAMLNAGVHPVVPRYGSIGAADLCLMAHIGLVVGGEGEAELAGERLPGSDALAAAGIRPAVLRLKDGLALCSSSSVSAGAGTLALVRARRLLDTLQAAAALSMEGFRASLTPLDPRAIAARPAPGQQWAAAGLRALLAGGSLTQPGAARRLQDPISFRCVSQIHGSLHAALELLEAAVGPEVNGSTDNPMVLTADDLVMSTGNFQAPAVALAADAVALGIAQVASPAAERIGRLNNAELSGLPGRLTLRSAGRAGMAALQKPAHALLSEIRHRAAPLCMSSTVTASGVEDDSTNAAAATLRLSEQLDLLTHLIAIELVCAAQAVDLAAPERLGDGTRAMYELVREHVEPLDDDRSLSADFARLGKVIA